MVFFGVKIFFFSLRSAAEIFFPDTLSRHYFFSTKTIIFKAQSANRIFVSTHFRDRKPKTIAPPHLQVKWMFPYQHISMAYDKINVQENNITDSHKSTKHRCEELISLTVEVCDAGCEVVVVVVVVAGGLGSVAPTS